MTKTTTPPSRFLHTLALLLLSLPAAALANTAPSPVILSAAMRPGTTLMDVVFRVTDPDDPTVKVRALAFVDGVRSFANVLRPVTFVEGTAAKIGDAIASNTNHTLTWDVGADWNIDLGQVKFEILARDARGLLAFDWISIPAAGGHPALTISKDAPSDASVLSALFWQYADGDQGLTLTNGVLTGNAGSGNFSAVALANGASIQNYSRPYIFKQMNVDAIDSSDVIYAAGTARAGILNTGSWHASNRNYAGVSVLQGWGSNADGQTTIPIGLTEITAVAAGDYFSLVLKSDGTVLGLGRNWYGQTTIPAGLTGVIAIAAGNDHSLALKNDGTVVAWGKNNQGQTTIPPGLSGVTAIRGGADYSLALKNDGTVIGWGANGQGQTTIPPGLNGVTAIAAGGAHGLALKNDGTVIAWGFNYSGQTTIPAGLTGVISIAAGNDHSLALKNDGTIVGWGGNSVGQTTIPVGLTGATAIAAGSQYSLAIKSNGSVIGWGSTDNNKSTIPVGLTGVTAIAAGGSHGFTLKAKGP